MTRRKFIRRAALASLGAVGSTSAYGFWEAAHIQITRETVPVPNLPPAFQGKTIAVVADLHHGPYVSLDFIRRAAELTNSVTPDIVALVGDYGHKGSNASVQLAPCLEVLSAITAPLGVFAVPGNHDMHLSGQLYREAIAATPLADLTNRHQCVSLNGDHLWIAGVDELWWGKPDINKALAGVPADAAVILLSHNPDFAEDHPDSRVGLMLSGHTHGGQVYAGGLSSRWTPSKYGMKYRRGLVPGPASNVFVSRGLGEAGIPLRIGAPPELCLLTLQPA